MLRSHRKNIFCLESLWDKQIEEKLSVLPLLEVTSKCWNIDYVHLTSNTTTEFEFNLKLAPRKKSYQILYLAFHGESRCITFLDQDHLDLEALAGLMGNRFKGWAVHFGSCSTLKAAPLDLKLFMEQTGISVMTGYTKMVDWAESAALDLLLFRWMQEYRKPSYLRKRLLDSYPDLVRINGFEFYSRND
jgi:hypothetical protein